MTAVPVGSNVEQIERLMGALGAGDDATVLDLVDPAIELVPLVVAAGLVPDSYRGLDGIRAYLEDAAAADIERGFVASRMSAAHDTVVAFGTVFDRAEGATMPAIWIWRLRDGLATHGSLVSDEGALRSARDGHPRLEPAPRGAARSPLCLELPAVAESPGDARHAVRIWADNLTLTSRERNDVLLAVSEATTNAVIHGYAGAFPNAAFRLRAEVSDGQLLVTVADEGVGLDVASRHPGLGMGLPLLAELAKALTLVGPPERPRGLEVRMWFALASLTAQRSG